MKVPPPPAKSINISASASCSSTAPGAAHSAGWAALVRVIILICTHIHTDRRGSRPFTYRSRPFTYEIDHCTAFGPCSILHMTPLLMHIYMMLH